MTQQQHFMTLSEVLAAAQSEIFRWTASRKAVIVEAVCDGKLSGADVEKLLGVSAEEFGSWSRSLDRHGVPGLRLQKLQAYEPHRRKAVGPAPHPAAAVVPNRVPVGQYAEDWQTRRAIMRQRFG
jgi:Protein of unknown function (DUF1153)